MSAPKEISPTEYAFTSMAEYYASLPPMRGIMHGKTLSDGTRIHVNYRHSRPGRIESYAGMVSSSIRIGVVFHLGQTGLWSFGINERLLGDSFVGTPEAPSFRITGEQNPEEDLLTQFRNASKPFVDWIMRITLEDQFSFPPILLT